MEPLKSWRIPLFLIFAMVFTVLTLVPRAVHAQSTPEPTRMSIVAPEQAVLGEHPSVQAVLVDSHGNPISKATIYFTAPATFLNKSGDVVLAQAITDKNGKAVAHFPDNFSGPMTLRAEFRGDDQYAASDAIVQIDASGNGQVYKEDVGVAIPGFTAPPVSQPVAAFQPQAQEIAKSFDRLWPGMTGWPIAAALIIVWAMYFHAVTLIFRIARPEKDAAETRPVNRRRLR